MITEDKELKQLVETKVKTDESDELLNSVIFAGKNHVVDAIIASLQKSLERKVPFVPYARLAGTDGMRLSRAAFALMMKFSEYFEDF